jgi:hypothetical protein
MSTDCTFSNGRRQERRGPLATRVLPGPGIATARARSIAPNRPATDADVDPTDALLRRVDPTGAVIGTRLPTEESPAAHLAASDPSDACCSCGVRDSHRFRQVGGQTGQVVDRRSSGGDASNLDVIARPIDAGSAISGDPDLPSRTAVTRRATEGRGRAIGESLDSGAAHNLSRSAGLAAHPPTPEPSPTFHTARPADLPAYHHEGHQEQRGPFATSVLPGPGITTARARSLASTHAPVLVDPRPHPLDLTSPSDTGDQLLADPRADRFGTAAPSRQLYRLLPQHRSTQPR